MIDGVEPSFPWAWWWAGGCALLGLLIAFLLGFRHHTRASRQKNQRALHLLRSACQNNNAHEAQSALLRWANGRFPGVDVLNVHQLGKLVHDTALKKQLFLLSQALYRETQDAEWQGEALWRSMVCYLRKKPTKKNQKRSLPPINPN
jgi:hypothetical protein